MSAASVVEKAWREAASLGILAAISEVIRSIVAGKPDQAERLARNAALAAAAKLAARTRIKASKR